MRCICKVVVLSSTSVAVLNVLVVVTSSSRKVPTLVSIKHRLSFYRVHSSLIRKLRSSAARSTVLFGY